MNDHLERAQHHVDCTISELKENSFQTELETEKQVAHAKGFISSLRDGKLIEHEDFKALNKALDDALRDWLWKHDELV
jgi:hypothetical protein